MPLQTLAAVCSFHGERIRSFRAIPSVVYIGPVLQSASAPFKAPNRCARTANPRRFSEPSRPFLHWTSSINKADIMKFVLKSFETGADVKFEIPDARRHGSDAGGERDDEA